MPLYNPNRVGVSTVSATPPLISSGGTTPNISIEVQGDGLYGISFSGGLTFLEPVGLSNYLDLNGHGVMEGVLDMGGFDINNVNTVSGIAGNYIDLTSFVVGSNTNNPLDYAGDYSANYNERSVVDKKYIDDLFATVPVPPAFVEQTHTSGPTVIINDNTTILYVDPVSTIASLTITLPATPVNGQEVKISYGGSITSGPVVTTLTIEGNTGHTVLGGSTLITADAGDGYIFKFQSSTNLWRIF